MRACPLVAFIVAVVVGAAPAALAAPCPVPTGSHPTIQSAIDDGTCTEIELGSQTYTESIAIGRTLSVSGVSSSASVIAGRVQLTGTSTVVSLADLTADGSDPAVSGCFREAVDVDGGAQLVGSNIVVINGDGEGLPALRGRIRRWYDRSVVGRNAVSNSSDELRWRVGRASPETPAEAVEENSGDAVAWIRCLALFSSDEKVPGTAPIASRKRRSAWHRSHRADEHKEKTMKNAQTLTALLAIVALCSVPVFGENLEPLTVSPGATDRVTGVEVRCPTFSWQAVNTAVGYEVVVYELPPQADLAAWTLDDAVEVLFVELPSGVTAWTPSLESGLARGADHVWFVRGVIADAGLEEVDSTEWSVARFFRVAGGVQTRNERVTQERVADPGTGLGTMRARSGITEAGASRSAMAKRVGEENTKDVGTAMAAIRGEMPDATGETYGVVGTSNSADGAGLGAVNTAGGPDLVLDGVEDGETDLDVYQWGIDRASAGVESFGFSNSISGSLDVWIQGNVDAYALFGDGAGVTDVDAETLDGIDSADFSPLTHLHDGRYFTETELNTSGGGGSVHWDNLGAVPTGLGDGDDDTIYTSSPPITISATNIALSPSFCTGNGVIRWTGSSWACTSIGGASLADSSITSNHIVDETIDSDDILDGTIASIDVLNNSLTDSDLAQNSVGHSEIWGTEVGLYTVPSWCEDGGGRLLTVDPECISKMCFPGPPAPKWFSCGPGPACTELFPAICPNILQGYLLAP